MNEVRQLVDDPLFKNMTRLESSKLETEVRRVAFLLAMRLANLGADGQVAKLSRTNSTKENFPKD